VILILPSVADAYLQRISDSEALRRNRHDDYHAEDSKSVAMSKAGKNGPTTVEPDLRDNSNSRMRSARRRDVPMRDMAGLLMFHRNIGD